MFFFCICDLNGLALRARVTASRFALGVTASRFALDITASRFALGVTSSRFALAITASHFALGVTASRSALVSFLAITLGSQGSPETSQLQLIAPGTGQKTTEDEEEFAVWKGGPPRRLVVAAPSSRGCRPPNFPFFNILSFFN